MSTPYPNCTITFQEPFPRIEFSPQKKYYVRACIDQMPEQEIRIDKKQQLNTIDFLIRADKKLLNAIVQCDSEGNFAILKHSPQDDFFDLVEV